MQCNPCNVPIVDPWDFWEVIIPRSNGQVTVVTFCADCWEEERGSAQ